MKDSFPDSTSVVRNQRRPGRYDSTTLIPPGITAHVDRFGNIVIETGNSAEAQALAAATELQA